MKQRDLLFELCCGSADDVAAAEAGGAGRAELNSCLPLGGLTPTVGTLLTAKRVTRMPILCMVRPRAGGFCYSAREFEAMLLDAEILLDHGADGIVFGILNENGTVDRARTARMLSTIKGKQSVFHRAIDVTPDVFAALDALMELGVTRVLTSGQAPSVPLGIARIQEMLFHAAGRIEILPGGGITAENAAACRAALGVTMLHATAHKTVYDRSMAANPAVSFCGAASFSEDRCRVGDAMAVRRICEAMAT